MPPRIFHLTSIYHLPMILLDGQLKVVESNISLDPRRTHAGPDVVWLTTSPRHGQGWASMSPQYSYVDKCRIVIEVDLSDAEPWWPWAERHGSEFIHMRALATSGDENVPRHVRDEVTPEVFRAAAIQRARRQWYVVERPVPWPQWVSITDQVAGTIIWLVVWFLLGFVAYALAFAAVAALVSRQEDVASVVTPVLMFLIIGYVLGVSILPAAPDSPLIKVMSLIPLFAPTLMPMRIAMGGVPVWQMIVSVGGIAVLIPLLVWLAGRIYRNAVVRSGARVRLSDAWRPA